ncbi:hypothetical protein JW960_18155 [candidate division KSB1 bacterium]|nr:hypothetical protein [candidate division KSB1 bacterium]
MKKCIYIVCFLGIMIVHTTLTYPQLMNDQQNNNNLISNEIDYYFNEKLAGTPTENQFMPIQTIFMPVKFCFDPLPELNIRTKITIKMLISESFDDTISYSFHHTCNLDMSPIIVHYDQVSQTDEMIKQKLKLIEAECYMVPTEIGGYYLVLRGHPGHQIRFRLDEAGKLVYLGKDSPGSFRTPELPNHPPLNTETVKLRHPRGCMHGAVDFDGYMLLSPPFTLNTVSTVEVHLTSRASFPDGVVLKLSNYVDTIISDSLTSWSGPISADDEYVARLKVQSKRPGASYFAISLFEPFTDQESEYDRSQKRKFVFTVYYALDDDGKAYYIGTESLENWYQQYYPEKLESLKLPDHKEFKRTFSKPTLKRQ